MVATGGSFRIIVPRYELEDGAAVVAYHDPESHSVFDQGAGVIRYHEGGPYCVKEDTMRKLAILLLAGMLVAGTVAVVGCGGTRTEEITLDEEDVKVTEENGEVKVETDEGEASVSTKVPTEDEIGIPIYPGAQMYEDSAGSVTTTDEKGKTTYTAAVLYTDDPVAKVVEWYKDKLTGKPGFVDMSTTQAGEDVGLFMFQSGETLKTVTIAEDTDIHPGKTAIAVASVSGADIPPTAP